MGIIYWSLGRTICNMKFKKSLNKIFLVSAYVENTLNGKNFSRSRKITEQYEKMLEPLFLS